MKDAFPIIMVIVFVIICILIFGIVFIEVDAERNCQKHEIVCYRSEGTFLGTSNVKTRCSNNNWDYQEVECVDPGYFWERN